MLTLDYVCCFSRRHSDKVGGFWRGWADIPVDVIRDVSYLLTSSECKHLLANSLLDIESGGIHRDEIVQSSDEVFTTLDLWITNQGDKATLDRLFRFMQTVDLFEALKERLNERLKSQKPIKGECVFLINLVFVLIWFSFVWWALLAFILLNCFVLLMTTHQLVEWN